MKCELDSEEVDGVKTLWSLPHDIRENVFVHLRFYGDSFRLKLVSRSFKKLLESESYHRFRGETYFEEATLTSLYFFIKDGLWHWSGFDLILKIWRRLPPFTCLPPPESNLFKEYLVSGGGGILCVNVSKSLQSEKLVVYNPLTQRKRELPPLKFPRNPVLMHVLANLTTQSFKVIVAGSSGIVDASIEEHISRKTEVFDSVTSEWKVTGDIPGPDYALNEYQTGVCVCGILYCIGFLNDGSGKGVLAYSVEEGVWLSNWRCSLPTAPFPEHTLHISIAQLVESGGEVYLFLEREHGRNTDHCIYKLENVENASSTVNQVTGQWKNVVKEPKTGGRGLLVYPEYTCVPYGEGKLCIFNTIEHTGVAYDIHHVGEAPEVLPPASQSGDSGFYSLNPLNFTFKPSFKDIIGSENGAAQSH